ncbi:PEP-utilizing enzyme [Gordonia terrae]
MINVDNWFADSAASDTFPLYTRANAGEVAPRPITPLGWSLLWQRGCIPGTVDGYIESCLFDEGEAEDLRAVFGCFGGYLMLNLSVLRRRMARTPGVDVAAMEHTLIGRRGDVPPYAPDANERVPERDAAVAEFMQRLLASSRLDDVDQLAEVSAAVREQRPDLTRATDTELVSHARMAADHVRACYAAQVHMSTGSSAGSQMVSRACAAAGQPEAAIGLLAQIGDVDSVGPVEAIERLAEAVRSEPGLAGDFDRLGPEGLSNHLREQPDTPLARYLRGFLDDFGHRGPSEWDPGADSWATNPGLVLRAVHGLGRRGESDVTTRTTQNARDDVRGTLDDAGRLALDEGVRVATLFVRGRERCKATMVRLGHEIRVVTRELGRRHLVEATDIAMLTDAELDEFVRDPEPWRPVLRERAAEFGRLELLDPPYIVDHSPPPLSRWPHRNAARPSAEISAPTSFLRGLPGSPGVVRGRVRVLASSAEADELLPGEVLVTTTVDPSWTLVFPVAAAIVVETGSAISHAVIVSRELGIPSVVSVGGAASVLSTGDVVEVDGGRGTVTVDD